MHIPTQKASCGVSFFADVVDMGLPAQVGVDGDPEIFCIINSGEFSVMKNVARGDVVSLIANSQDFTLTGIKSHPPFSFPCLKVI